MNVLYIACSCSPYHGSEDKIGWSVPLESAKTNRVFVITREEQRQYVECYLTEHPEVNVRFYFVDIPRIYKKLLSKAHFTPKLNLFHRYAFRLAKKICQEEQIDLIHQITPVEFRSIGDYGKIPNVKFICGPIAGGQIVPKQLFAYTGNHCVIEILRMAVNEVSRLKLALSRKLRSCDYLLFANCETERFLRNCKQDDSKMCVLTDVATDEIPDHCVDKKESIVRFSVVGRLVYLKGHRFLLEAIRRLPIDRPYECVIVGSGKEERKLKKCVREYQLGAKVRFEHAVPYTQISQVYEATDVLIVPSFREATGSVILEAMAHGVPVITINRFGGATILDENTGWLYDGSTKEEFVENLKNAIISCIENPLEVKRRGDNARERAQQYTWEAKMKKYQEIYDSLVSADE